MSIQDWGAVGELLGSIAVLLTLFYLARQISESNKLARTSSSQVVTDNYISLNDLIISNPALAGCLAQLKAPGAEFTPAETVQLEHYCYRYFAMFAAAQTSYDNGHLDQATY
jgi:hypothetical protein